MEKWFCIVCKKGCPYNQYCSIKCSEDYAKKSDLHCDVDGCISPVLYLKACKTFQCEQHAVKGMQSVANQLVSTRQIIGRDNKRLIRVLESEKLHSKRLKHKLHNEQDFASASLRDTKRAREDLAHRNKEIEQLHTLLDAKNSMIASIAQEQHYKRARTDNYQYPPPQRPPVSSHLPPNPKPPTWSPAAFNSLIQQLEQYTQGKKIDGR